MPVVTADIDQFTAVTAIGSPLVVPLKYMFYISEFYNNSRHYIINKIPKEIFNMTNLKIISFSNIKIKIIPKEILNLKVLKKLYLNYSYVEVMNFRVENTMIELLEVYGNSTIFGFALVRKFFNKVGKKCWVII